MQMDGCKSNVCRRQMNLSFSQIQRKFNSDANKCIGWGNIQQLSKVDFFFKVGNGR